MTTKNKTIKRTRGIRTGDRVRIMRPDFFVRCGYPMGLRDTEDKVKKEHGQAIVDFLESFNVKVFQWTHSGIAESVPSRTYDEVVKAMAYGIMRRDSFGGRQRTIHTKNVPEYGNEVFTVQGVRFVKTGEWAPGGQSGYYGEDYDPPYLANENTHRILDSGLYYRGLDDAFPYGSLWIEATNVERIQT